MISLKNWRQASCSSRYSPSLHFQVFCSMAKELTRVHSLACRASVEMWQTLDIWWFMMFQGVIWVLNGAEVSFHFGLDQTCISFSVRFGIALTYTVLGSVAWKESGIRMNTRCVCMYLYTISYNLYVVVNDVCIPCQSLFLSLDDPPACFAVCSSL